MNKFRIIFCAAAALALSACRTIEPEGLCTDSALRLLIAGISADVSSSKATPDQLEKPLAGEFNVRVVRNSNGAVVFNRLLGDAETLIKVASGEQYTVTASYGKNALLAINEPYYEGTALAEVPSGQTKTVEVECSVGNSLISARFGSDQQGQERFGKYFSECSLDVYAGDFVVSLPFAGDGISAYLRVGADFSLAFSGIMKETGEKRSFALPVEMVPQSLNAADHLVITLDLKVETGLDVTISKAELVEDNVDGTIPFSWLPLPAFASEHKFDSNGILVGTDLSCSASYPGCEWTAQVRNSSGMLVRTLTGEGALSSPYSSSSDWPYLPSGTYTATFSYRYDDHTVEIAGRARTFTIAPPSGIKAYVSGYSSLDKYKSGDITGANACNAFTLYDTSVSLGISNEIKTNGNYAALISAASGSVWIDTDTGRKNFTGSSTGNFSSLAAGNHSFNASLTFDGAQTGASLPFIITGLPVSFNPPTEAAGWQGHGTVKFDSDNVQLGRDAWSNPHYIDYNNVFVPMGTKVKASYDVNPHGGTVQTTISLYFGDIEYFSKKSSYMSDSRVSGNKVFLTSSDVTYIKVNSSYGSGATRSHIYSLAYEYAQ